MVRVNKSYGISLQHVTSGAACDSLFRPHELGNCAVGSRRDHITPYLLGRAQKDRGDASEDFMVGWCIYRVGWNRIDRLLVELARRAPEDYSARAGRFLCH